MLKYASVYIDFFIENNMAHGYFTLWGWLIKTFFLNAYFML